MTGTSTSPWDHAAPRIDFGVDAQGGVRVDALGPPASPAWNDRPM
ncbi:hypothetical protein [Catenulispora subtropica]